MKRNTRKHKEDKKITGKEKIEEEKEKMMKNCKKKEVKKGKNI